VRDIVRDLQIFSRGNEEKRGAVDLQTILDSTARLAWNEIRHRARLTTDYGPAALVDGNESRLGQVFLNLVVNAAQAIQEGAAPENEIRIATRMVPEGEVMVEITDTGSGMSPEVLRRLFVPFFTTKPVGVGTGLGLSICQRIVTSFGGRMTVDSTVGKGTSVRVFLPIARTHDADTPTIPETAPPPNAQRRGNILIIDDDALVLGSLADGVSLEHGVKSTTSAQTALEWIRAGEQFDVIFCDVMMPSMGGEEFYAQLRRVSPEQIERVVFLTGGAFTPQSRAFFDAISNLKVNKPASLNDVLDTIRTMLDH
jgi:CheY-like chemotaxis protein